jgi:hypothetical protein
VSELKSRPPVRACVIAAVFCGVGIATLLWNKRAIPFAVTFFAISAWVVIQGLLESTVRLTEHGVDFVTLGGRQHWPWSEISAAHLTGTGTIPGIAVYRGGSCLRVGRWQFADLGSAARYIESHVSPAVVRGSWHAG